MLRRPPVQVSPGLGANTHVIKPGEDPQTVADSAAAGDRLIFTAGVHEHPVGAERAILFLDKTLHVTLEPGAILRGQAGESVLQTSGEVINNQSTVLIGLDDLEAGGTYTESSRTSFRVQIDATGTPDTFAWTEGVDTSWEASGVAITGGWQTLKKGVQIRFGATTGHTLNSRWDVCYGGQPIYGIRVGTGTHATPIGDVTIDGLGTIDTNLGPNNVRTQALQKHLSAGVLLHGRVRRARVQGVTFLRFDRPVIAYGDHTGTYASDGSVTGGESFDMEDIEITHTRAEGDGEGDAYLIGHPEFRGDITRVRCNHNHFNGGGTAFEPNFNLTQFEVIGNTFVSPGANGVHLWRGPSDGRVAMNTRLGDDTGLAVVTVSSPAAWPSSTGIFQADNVNLLSDTP